jgi:hypothetical protein
MGFVKAGREGNGVVDWPNVLWPQPCLVEVSKATSAEVEMDGSLFAMTC